MGKLKKIKIPRRKSSGPEGQEVTLTKKQKKFCDEYIKDFDYHRAFRAAGYSASSIESENVQISNLRRLDHVWAYLKMIQQDAEKIVGLSRSKILQMHKDIVDSSIADLHNTWITKKDFDSLTPKQKWCIAEIETKVRREVGDDDEMVDVEYVRIKLLDRQKALDAIARMGGYDAPSKLELTGDKEAIAGLFPFGK